ncbi:MAG: hypothetical protein WCH62_05475 [Candidatus Omnitrophota bacterium]
MINKICSLIIVLLLIVSTVSAADELLRKTNWLATSQEHIFYKNGVKVSREELALTGRNVIISEGQIPDGVYRDEGERKEVSYQNGKLNGPMKQYLEDGKLSYEHEMKDDKPISLKSYFPDGNVKSQTVFNDDGSYIEKIFDENGQIVKTNKKSK